MRKPPRASGRRYPVRRTNMASVTAALAEGLQRRGADPRTARMAASCAVTAYQATSLDRGERPDEDFSELMRIALTDLRKAVRGRPR